MTQLELEAVVVREAQDAGLTSGRVRGEALLPEVERGLVGDGELQRVDRSRAGAALAAPGNSNHVRIEPGAPVSSPK